MAKLIATKLSSDPYDDRDGLWFSACDLEKLRELPAGTKLFIGCEEDALDKALNDIAEYCTSARTDVSKQEALMHIFNIVNAAYGIGKVDIYVPTTKDIKEMRELTGLGFYSCRRALKMSNGDKERAHEILRGMML